MQVANQFVDDPTRVVNRLTVAAPTQVNLQVRIAEVARNVDRQLGIQWNDVSVGINGGRIGFRGGAARCRATTRRPTAPPAAASTSTWCCRRWQEEGLVTIMAEPNLTARSGEPATFLAGGEYPYSTVSDDGTNIQFKNFGIGLNFTPTVVDGNRISLVGRHRGERARTSPRARPCRRSAPAAPRRRSTSPAARASPSPG